MTEPRTEVTVYWRERCPYCIRLRWQLRRVGLPTSQKNIWKDRAAAARVREITGGDETVPTLVIGSRSLVNPTIGEVLTEVRTQFPQLLDEAARERPGRLAALFGRDRDRG